MTPEITKDKHLQKDLANRVHDMMLGKLHDIEGIDYIDLFPLAPGWWAIIVITLVIFLKISISRIRQKLFQRTWQYKILTELDDMEKSLKPSEIKTISTKLAELLKRLAMHKFSRQEVAGLEGINWLKWLKNNDKHRFDWEKHGEILIKAPYAPQNSEYSAGELSKLIKATKNWVM